VCSIISSAKFVSVSVIIEAKADYGGAGIDAQLVDH